MPEVVETKLHGSIVDSRESTNTRGGQPIGIVIGHLAVWSMDQHPGRFGVPDIFHPGTWLDSIAEHKRRNNRPIRLKYNHNEVMGGFPIESVKEDSTGLFVEGEINLVSRLGQEKFSLAKQGILTDFSVAFIAREDKLTDTKRDVFKADIVEGSITDEPRNQKANIDEIKAAVDFQDLELADRMFPWNINAAKNRVRDLTNSKSAPTEEYKTAFTWFDEERSEQFDGYRLQIADVVDGKLVAVPRAIFKAANAVQKNTVAIPEEDRKSVIDHLEKYYTKMGLVSPFTKDDESKSFFDITEVKTFTRQDLQRILDDTGAFSRQATKFLASKFDGVRPFDLVAELKKIELSLR